MVRQTMVRLGTFQKTDIGTPFEHWYATFRQFDQWYAVLTVGTPLGQWYDFYDADIGTTIFAKLNKSYQPHPVTYTVVSTQLHAGGLRVLQGTEYHFPEFNIC